MKNTFPELKSQAEIDNEEFGFKFFKWYMYVSVGFTLLFYVMVITALIKYFMS